EFVEASVNVELEGDFDASFTDGDNRLVIATDTCKNTVYVVAKDDPLDSIESFGLALARHFIGRYDHVTSATISLTETVWDRIDDSPHGFRARDKATPTAVVSLARDTEPVITSGIEKLVIAKTTESGFVDFHDDDIRTLADTDDRIFATELSGEWTYNQVDLDFAAAREAIMGALFERFLDHYSRSVQETLYKMGEAALSACDAATRITLTMPNKHHLLADMKPFGRENDNEVFVVTDEPFGYITGTVARTPKPHVD
ncbi:MAG: factor-independent urate hydroxylase, partial [Planctomycetota bacterium]